MCKKILFETWINLVTCVNITGQTFPIPALLKVYIPMICGEKKILVYLVYSSQEKVISTYLGHLLFAQLYLSLQI